MSIHVHLFTKINKWFNYVKYISIQFSLLINIDIYHKPIQQSLLKICFNGYNSHSQWNCIDSNKPESKKLIENINY